MGTSHRNGRKRQEDNSISIVRQHQTVGIHSKKRIIRSKSFSLNFLFVARLYVLILHTIYIVNDSVVQISMNDQVHHICSRHHTVRSYLHPLTSFPFCFRYYIILAPAPVSFHLSTYTNLYVCGALVATVFGSSHSTCPRLLYTHAHDDHCQFYPRISDGVCTFAVKQIKSTNVRTGGAHASGAFSGRMLWTEMCVYEDRIGRHGMIWYGMAQYRTLVHVCVLFLSRSRSHCISAFLSVIRCLRCDAMRYACWWDHCHTSASYIHAHAHACV